jgi:hypothetical protein
LFSSRPGPFHVPSLHTMMFLDIEVSFASVNLLLP